MTLAEIEIDARRLLQDEDESRSRWSADDIRSAAQNGVAAINALRPETRYVEGTLVDYVEIPEDSDEEIAMHPRFREALVYFMAYQCLLHDSSDTVNAQLADSYLGKFNARVMT